MADKKILTPDIGASTWVSVIEVLVKSGDVVDEETSIVTLESDKATMEVPAEIKGTVKEVVVKVGDNVTTGTPLVVVEVAEAKQERTKPTEKKQPEKREPEKREKKETLAAPTEKKTPSIEEKQETIPSPLVHAGPGVRRLARELSLNLTEISGTGPKSRITKDDVRNFVQSRMSGSGAALPFGPMPVIDFAQFGPIEIEPLSRIKKISGKNLQRNWMTIPHVFQFGEADITEFEAFRQTQRAAFEKQNTRFTPLVFIMKAVVASLRAFPHFNASLDASGENLIVKKYFHLGIAVDTPNGLVVPVIRDVDQKGMLALAKELTKVSEKARKGQLAPGDMQGACFTISSLGGIGGTAFTPIINAPEVGILGVSRTREQAVWQDGAFMPRLMLPLSLSHDHRVIDGAEGARFLVHLTNMLSDIRNILL